VPKVEVSFDIDANGILSVHAKDTATGKDQHITITASSGLSEAEIQKMVKDAAAHEADDKARREQVERRNKLDNLCYTVEKTLGTTKDKLAASDVAALEALIVEGRKAIELQDDAMATSIIEKLEKEAHRVATAAYQSAEPAAEPAAEPPRAARRSPPAGVVVAEFEETSP
jgi:molecular chaperone DnaK